MLDRVGDIDPAQVGMAPESVAHFVPRHRLGPGGTFGPAGAEVQNGFPLAAQLAFDEDVEGIDLHPLRAPT